MANKRDYYEILSVQRTAPKDEIIIRGTGNSALNIIQYRNKSPEAEEKFKEISEAYAVLSDSDKRQRHMQWTYVSHVGTETVFRGSEDNFAEIFKDMGFGGVGDISNRYLDEWVVVGATAMIAVWVGLDIRPPLIGEF